MNTIIVKSNSDMEKVISWLEQSGNRYELKIPFRNGRIEYKEELLSLDFTLETENTVKMLLSVYNEKAKGYLKMIAFVYDFLDNKISDISYGGEAINRTMLQSILMQDNTIGKNVLKFKAIMLFAANYHHEIKKTISVIEKKPSDGKRQNKNKSHRNKKLVNYTYTFETANIDKVLDSIPKEKRAFPGYSHTFDVRGHYRHLKTGRTIWIRSYQKGKGIESETVYILNNLEESKDE